ncbi:hypothetical protein BDQ94DRAFT_142884 [Aspergillus welwitschiae]|uniref:Uncharacterized protein n=1 Tax=Aspergillus welwitschiae TaxID=1341132 RepID=A0A3F3Q3X5_9EURO|nr:hypothetical protein BDQ94DRAFT_142884 [Aspergillus welwitschiae]RDH33909.1 hypothetical protein BDQ94DRAFT_142884 [Aspergillus welwitschiae]
MRFLSSFPILHLCTFLHVILFYLYFFLSFLLSLFYISPFPFILFISACAVISSLSISDCLSLIPGLQLKLRM